MPKKPKKATPTLPFEQDLIEVGITERGMTLGSAIAVSLLPHVEQMERAGVCQSDIQSYLRRIVNAVVFRRR